MMLLPVFAEISGKTPIYENTKNLFWNLCKTLTEKINPYHTI